MHDLHKTMKLLGEDKAPYYGMTWTEGQNRCNQYIMFILDVKLHIMCWIVLCLVITP